MIDFNEQLNREISADEEAAAETLKQYIEAASSGNIDALPRTKLILGRLFGDIKARIEAFQAQPAKGPRSQLRLWLREIDSSVAAVISLRIVLSKTQAVQWNQSSLCTFQNLAQAIGSAWEVEVMTQKAYKVNPVYVDRALSNLKNNATKSESHTKRTMQAVYTNLLQLSDDSGLGSTERMMLGKFGLQACVDSGLVFPVRAVNSKGILVTFELNPEIAEFLKPTNSDVGFITERTNLTMIAPPREWTSPGEGGYYSERRQAVYPLRETTRGVLRKSIRREYRNDLQVANMPVVYKVVNYLQSVPFEVKQDIYDLVSQIWREGGGVLGVPKPKVAERPEFPLAADWKKEGANHKELEAFQMWKHAVVRYYSDEVKNVSKVRECTTFLKVARDLKGRAVYHPVYLDFRGRLYYRGNPNPQGTDLSRAVLHFHRKKALGKRGVYWLKVHIANSLGYDSVSFDERVQYVEERWKALESDLSAPADSEVYRLAENPLCAISAVLELSKAYASGNPETYETGCVVHMDATCSGLQHFSAILRDPIGGSYVNLVNVGKKADIYLKVANLVKERITEHALGDDAKALYATLWKDIPIERKLAKKPVMTYVYGATKRGVSNSVWDYLVELGWKNETVTIGRMADYMASVLFDAIEQAVPAAAEAMRWLRSLIAHFPKNTPVCWKTPLGFPVVHDYRKIEETRIRVRSCGLQYVVSYDHTDETNPQGMRNAISPNFIHSLDATHLMMTADAMQDAGLDMVTIHDSFGTHPSDVDTLLRLTKEMFVKLYTENDVLKSLVMSHTQEINTPALGDLDLNEVIKSPFFFT